ncbi:MAG: hypothetical protein Q4A06_10115 [Cardiobacteriaceae bacterium]|nr:hypothetical protein [Cardiobacteriaceae bacterium]
MILYFQKIPENSCFLSNQSACYEKIYRNKRFIVRNFLIPITAIMRLPAKGFAHSCSEAGKASNAVRLFFGNGITG